MRKQGNMNTEIKVGSTGRTKWLLMYHLCSCCNCFVVKFILLAQFITLLPTPREGFANNFNLGPDRNGRLSQRSVDCGEKEERKRKKKNKTQKEDEEESGGLRDFL